MSNIDKINEFAGRYSDMFIDLSMDKAAIDEKGFADECFNLGFGMDGGRKFIVSCPGVDAFNDVNELNKVIDNLDNLNILGSAIAAKWEMIGELDENLRMWFVTMLRRIEDLTDEREPMTVQEISAMLKEHREELLEKTELNTWDIDCWIHEPTQIMNMDSGIAYDVTAILGITIDDIIEAVEQEQMFSMLW